MNRKGKQRKSSVRRGARKGNWPKRAKNTAVAGIRTAPPANTVHKRHIYDTAYIHGRPKPMYGHTDTDTIGNFHIQIRLYGVSGYAVLPYVQFWPALNIVFVVMSVFKRCITHPWFLQTQPVKRWQSGSVSKDFDKYMWHVLISEGLVCAPR